MTNPQKIVCALEIAADLQRIGRELIELQADAEACSFHRAVLRIGRAREIVSMVSPALKVQAAKLASQGEHS